MGSYSDGDFFSARSNLRKARFLTANLYRKHLHKERAEAAGWVLEPDSVDDQSPGDANLIEEVNQLWNLIGDWLDTLILSLGREELMRSTDGIDLLIDRSLPNFWDVNHDIAVISGPNAVPITERLIALGQHQIVIVTDADVTVDQPVRHIEGPQRLDKPLISTIFTVQSGKSIDDQSLAALKKVELPSFTHIPTDTEGTALDTFESLAQQIRAQYIKQSTRRKLPITFVEQLLQNLPAISQMKSVADIGDLFENKNIMIVSAGPSLIDSLPAISRFRESFIIVSVVRSLPVLLDYGIHPDFAVILDAVDHTSEEHRMLPDDPRYRDIPLIVLEYAHRTTFEDRFKSYYLAPIPELVGNPISVALHGSSPPCAIAGSVSVFAASLFAQLNIMSITLVGQDLSMSKSGPSYASSIGSTQSNLAEREYLTCKGINGEELPTLADYYHYISEFEDFGLKCTKGIGLFNCTTFGAYLENWIHMPLNANHPAVAETVEPEASENIEGTLEPNLRPTLLGGEELLGAIDCELNLQEKTLTMSEAIITELEELLAGNSVELNPLETLEHDLRLAIQTSGSLISYYTLPAKLEADSSLESVSSLDENLIISLNYYSAIRSGARTLKNLLIEAKKSIMSNHLKNETGILN